MADIFEETISLGAAPKKVSNWLMVETMRLLKEHEMEPEDIKFSATNLAKLIKLTDSQAINSTVAKEVFEKIFAEDIDPDKYVEEIDKIRSELSSIVQGYGYKNVKEFLSEYRASKAEYTDYQSAVAEWEQQTGNKAGPDSLKAKLQRKTQEVKERENNRQSHHYRADRGGR